MRAAFLPLFLLLGACSGTISGFSPDPPASPEPTAAAAPAAAPSVAATSSRPNPAPGGSSAAGGGSRTAAARPPAEPVDPQTDPLTQARVDCWMKVETQRVVRDIDRRIAFVDKCVADAVKKQ
jgi:hypothetical protein